MTRCLIVILICLCSCSASAAELSLKVDFARHGDSILANVNYKIPADYHAYSHLPGTSGKPTNLDFVLENTGPMPVLYPPGAQEKDIYDPALLADVYSGNVSLIAILPGSSNGRLYALSLSMLLCSSSHCMPFQKETTGTVPETIPALETVEWKDVATKLLAAASNQQSASSGESASANSARHVPLPDIHRQSGAPIRKQDGEEEPNLANFNLDLKPRYLDAHLEIYSLGKALLIGLLAGLLLNAMPCVLPVLTLKVSSLLLFDNSEKKAASFRAHNLCFAAGIFTLFTILALLLGLADLMWGQLYQNQLLLLLMLLLVFLMGLSMLGVFTLPVLDLHLGENTRNPLLKSYLTGMISTFLATPCSGPMLGGVLAWAFAQPMAILTAVFWSVGAGMALPYIAFSIWPNLATLLPRPGNWMLVFERILGFLLLATSLYLLYILPEEKRMQILCLMLLASFCAWIWGTYCGLDAPALRRRLCGTLCVLLLGGYIAWLFKPGAPAVSWEDFSPETFTASLGHRDMLVEFTADWCPNCKFLEASVLTDKNLLSWQKKYGLELVKVDLTRSSPYAENLLAQLGSKSIPLTALFGKGEKARRPLVLRDLYGERALDRALKEAF